MLGSVAVALAFAASTPALDKAGLKQAMEVSRAAPVAGRSFRIEIPFVDGRKRNMATFQSPARWVYDYPRQQLDLIIGLGEITQTNYDGFTPQGLDRLPPLQTFIFDSRESKTQTLFNSENATKGREMVAGKQDGYRGYSLTLGDRTKVSSFGLAAPYDEKGASALPAGFKPLSIHKIDSLPQRELRAFVGQLRLVIEGEIIDLGQTPSVFCGAWKGGLKARQINDTLLIAVDANQCFVTAKVTRVSVIRPGAVLASWPR